MTATARVRASFPTVPALIAALCVAAAGAQEDRPAEDAASARDYFELGAVQKDLSELKTAAENYLRGVEILAELEGEFSPLLIDPYVSLADVYREDGQFPEAITVLEHAQHISQRNFGLFNSAQESILREMVRVYGAAGDTRNALQIQQRIFELGVRQHGEASAEIVPYHRRLAEYYEASRMRIRARGQHRAIVEIQEAQFGELSPTLLPSLRALNGYDILSGDAGFARRRMEEILAAGDPIEPLEHALALASLGDWELVLGSEENAEERYREAYAVLAESDAAAAGELFARPVAINFVPPLSPVDLTTRVRNYAWGEIVAEFEVSADGRPRYVTIIAAQPAGIMEERYRRRLRESYFRPRLAEGEPTATSRVRFRHAFRHFPAEREEGD